MTAADAELISHIAGYGYNMGPRQLKRWRAAGLLTAPVQKSMGRGAGLPSTAYPVESLRQASDIARCLGLRIPLRYVPLSLFAQDIPVRPALVLRAYSDFLDDLIDELGDGDPIDRADAAALHQLATLKRTSHGRAWIRRSGLYGARRSSDIEDMLVGLSGLLVADEEPSEEAKMAIGRIAGAADGEHEALTEHVRLMSLSNVRAVMETTEIAELRAALIVQRRVIALGVRMHRLQVLADSAALGAGLADIEPLDPVWEAIQALSLVPCYGLFRHYRSVLR